MKSLLFLSCQILTTGDSNDLNGLFVKGNFVYRYNFLSKIFNLENQRVVINDLLLRLRFVKKNKISSKNMCHKNQSVIFEHIL